MGRERRRHRRVVALSATDRERVARGELPEAEAEVERRRGLDALTQARARPDGAGEQANDARLLAEVPPHWG
ncbi:transcriptional regulator [Actinomyces respiraculi]|uniref:Transcriptional regulator n=1 Tax=Actinomyces respiraculi TaxID=2744574 RepID=A0A7T0LMF1_9ACTO|nr:transcriptional regulator [Actinomyces respiraculi]